jgi:rhamnogalacturonyl hydrolase YesR
MPCDLHDDWTGSRREDANWTRAQAQRRNSVPCNAWLGVWVVGIACAILLTGCGSTGTDPQYGLDEGWEVTDSTQAVMAAVAQYRLRRLEESGGGRRNWQHCTFFAGMMEAYGTTEGDAYLHSVLRWGRANDWMLGPRERHADDHCVGQVYLDVHQLSGVDRRLRATKEAFDRILANRRTGRDEWDWCDALFMAPPALARLAAATGNEQYWDLLSDYYWSSSEYLYEDTWNLYYRDEYFFNDRSPNGTPVFWARGNGWVLAGLARVLQVMPRDRPDYERFVRHFRKMAAAVVQRQGDDGLWRPNLLDPDAYPSPETSSTGFFAYALAWGVNEGHLEPSPYRAAALRAWDGLVRSVNDEGRLGWVQPVGARPEPVERSDEAPYGDGAFLLAGSEIIELRTSR